MAKAKVIIVVGSPRLKGNSAALAEQAASGARSAGAEVETFNLGRMEIKPCTACDVCRDFSNHDCIIEDDMRPLYPKLRGADAVAIASPIYWFTVSAQTKLFMDRCYALGGPQGHGFAGKRMGVLLAYADSDPFVSGAVNALRMFQDGFKYVGAELVGAVYGTASEPGEIAENREVMEKAYQLGRRLAGAA